MDAKQAAITSLAKQVNNREVDVVNAEATDFRAELERMLPRLAEASLRGMRPEFLMSSALSLIRSNESLRKCDKSSILHGIMQAALLGVRLDPVLGQACLVPRKGKAQFMMMYKGLVLLAHRSGKVRDVVAQVVYENDVFEMEYGSHRSLKHKPAKGDRGKAIGAYGFITTLNGGEFFEYLTIKEIEAIRDRGGYDPNRSSPWKSDTFAMYEKTAVKQALRLVPTDDPALSTAVTLDDLASHDVDQRITIADGALTHATFADADPEVPGDVAEETKRLQAAGDAAQKLLTYIKPKPEIMTDVILLAPVSQSAPNPPSQSAPVGPPGNPMSPSAPPPSLQFAEGPVQAWPELCLSVVGGAVTNKPDIARKLAAEWFRAAQTRLKHETISQADMDRITAQFKAWFPPKPVEGEQLELSIPEKEAAVPAAPASPPSPAPTPLIQPGSGLTATKQPKVGDGLSPEIVEAIEKATTVPMVLAIKSKIASNSTLTEAQKNALGQMAQDKFSAIKAAVRRG